MPDSTDASNSGLKQGIGSLAAFAIPALVAGLFGGGGALGALGAGMEGAGTLEANQEERQKQAGTMLEKMIQQQNLEAYRRQKIDLETQRNQEYSRNINSLIDTRGTQLQQGQARIDQAKLVDDNLMRYRNVEMQHAQVLIAKTNLERAQLNQDIQAAGGSRAWLMAHGFPQAASLSTKAVDQVMAHAAEQAVGDGVGSDPAVIKSHQDAASAMGVPAPIVKDMASWKPAAQAKLVQSLGENAQKGHAAMMTSMIEWAGGKTGAKGAGGAGGMPDFGGDAKTAAAFEATFGSAAGGMPLDQRVAAAKKIVTAIDQSQGLDPTSDIAAIDALNKVVSPGPPAAPSASRTTPAGATPAAPTSVAKPSAATPAAATKSTAKASAPIGRASLKDGDYTFADGRKVKVKDGKVYPAE